MIKYQRTKYTDIIARVKTRLLQEDVLVGASRRHLNKFMKEFIGELKKEIMNGNEVDFYSFGTFTPKRNSKVFFNQYKDEWDELDKNPITIKFSAHKSIKKQITKNFNGFNKKRPQKGK